VPLGVLAALYLREYARQGPLVGPCGSPSTTSPGVPSIVFGVFGLGFFVYFVGGTIDPAVLPGGAADADLRHRRHPVGVADAGAADRAGGDRRAEEALAAVPRIVREGSLALGATKFETIWRVVLPAAAPGILTGMILAMARAAGEVAPLMIVGMVKLAPALPIDGTSRSCTSNGSSCTSASTSTTSASRAQRRGGQAPGLRHRAAADPDGRADEPDGDRPAQPAAAQVRRRAV
jgi:phosphate transport system permease protein